MAVDLYNRLTGLGIGLLFSIGIAWLAHRKGSLTQSGAVAAVCVGTLIFGLGGWVWGVLLILFFLSSSVLSRFKEGTKAHLAAKFAKGSRRDAGQVLANGGLGAVLAALSVFYPQPLLLAAYVGAIAAVNADTWATELGVLATRAPRLITTGRRVEPGTSGGISWVGTAASAGGAGVIGLATSFLTELEAWAGAPQFARSGLGGVPWIVWLLCGLAGGFVGAMADSLLGATVQAIYYSETRDKETERRIEPDGTLNRHIRGWPWFGNDAVNWFCSAVGAAVGTVVWALCT